MFLEFREEEWKQEQEQEQERENHLNVRDKHLSDQGSHLPPRYMPWLAGGVWNLKTFGAWNDAPN